MSLPCIFSVSGVASLHVVLLYQPGSFSNAIYMWPLRPLEMWKEPALELRAPGRGRRPGHAPGDVRRVEHPTHWQPEILDGSVWP